MKVLGAVAVKPFGVAKARLSQVLDAPSRSRLGRAIAHRTLAAVAEAGAEPAVVTGDPGVAKWAESLGAGVVAEPGPGLDRAAGAVVAAASGSPWAMIHADLPIVTAVDFESIFTGVDQRTTVLAPAADGGTTVIASTHSHFDFRYGPGSFRAHLSSATAMGRALVVVRPGTALDLDTPQDLEIALSLRAGTWLRALVA